MTGPRQVLQTAGVETEANLPFAGLHQLMRPMLDMAGAADALSATQRRALFATSAPIQTVLPLTARLERAFAGRLCELPALTRHAVLVATVDSANELAEILAAAAVLAGDAVGTGDLDSASAAGLIRFDEMHVHFRHPLVRSGVLQGETVARRQAANAALAALPDPVDVGHVGQFLEPYGITKDDLIDRMGGSP